MRKMSLVVLACLMLARVASAQAEEPTLKVGDPAPKLYVDEWVKGEPVKEFEKGKVYVIECWATWCGPCIAAIPHVTELQHKYKDKGLIVIGMNIWEQDKERAKVKPFIEKMGDKMDYRIATDDLSDETMPRGKMDAFWMKAAGRRGIPSSFIVDQQGNIAWMGHPMQMDGPLADIIAGTFDPVAFQQKQDAIANLQTEYSKLFKDKDYDAAMAKLDEIEKATGRPKSMQTTRLQVLFAKGDSDAAKKLISEMEASAGTNATALTDLARAVAFRSRGDKSLVAEGIRIATKAIENGGNKEALQWLIVDASMLNGDTETALKTADEAIAASETPNAGKTRKIRILFNAKQSDAANKLAAELAKDADNDAQTLYAVGAALAVAGPTKQADLDLAKRLAERAAELDPKLKSNSLVLGARVHAGLGEYDKAAELQEEAITGMKAGMQKSMAEAVLKNYNKKAQAGEAQPAGDSESKGSE